MSDLYQSYKTFSNNEFGDIRVLEIENEPWFVGKDVATVLDYENQNRDIVTHVDKEDRKMFDKTQYQNGIEFNYKELGQRGGWLINESGLYSLILSSKLPNAKKFKRWVTSEVLPSIRKTGGYIPVNENMSDSEIMARALVVAQKTIENKDKLIEDMKPKAIFADAVVTSHSSILVGELAKLLKQNGIDIGQNRLFKWLRDKGYLIKRKGTDFNMPTQKSMDLGLFEIKERTINNPDGGIRITKTPKVTGKGQLYFVNKFKKGDE